MTQISIREISLVVLLTIVLLRTEEAMPMETEERVASVSLCADQMVVALLKKDRIAALSPQSRDSKLSMVATQANELPILPPTAEAFVLSDAAIVVSMAWDDARMLSMIERFGVRVIRINAVGELSAIVNLLHSLAAPLGVLEQSTAMATDLERRLALIAKTRPTLPLLAAYYRPDGGSAGGGTFVDAVLSAAGFRNLARTLGYNGWRRLDLESLVMNPPEVIIATFFEHPIQSFSRHRFSRHSVFHALQQRIPVIEIPGALMTCGTWSLLEATEFLSRYRTLRLKHK